MPLIRMDYDTATDGFRLSNPSMLDTPDAARRVVIMVHGYKFDPARADKTPHRHILDPRRDPAPCSGGLSACLEGGRGAIAGAVLR